jgi:acylphosphatase
MASDGLQIAREEAGGHGAERCILLVTTLDLYARASTTVTVQTMKVRANIIVKGRVGMAGFREMVDERAFPLELAGFVRELPDGTVEVVCEADREVIEAFIKRISIVRYPVRVTGVEVRYSDATGEFPDFRILREGGPISELCDRLEGALMLFRELQPWLAPLQDIGERQARLLAVQHKALERLDRSARLQQQLVELQMRALQRLDRRSRDGRAAMEIAGRLLKKQEAAVAALRSLDRHGQERMARLGRRQDRLLGAVTRMAPAAAPKRRGRRSRGDAGARKDAAICPPKLPEGATSGDGGGSNAAPLPAAAEGGVAG